MPSTDSILPGIPSVPGTADWLPVISAELPALALVVPRQWFS